MSRTCSEVGVQSPGLSYHVCSLNAIASRLQDKHIIKDNIQVWPKKMCGTVCRTRCYKVEIQCRNICVKSENQSRVGRLTLELRELLTVVKRWIITTTFMPRIIRLFLSRIYSTIDPGLYYTRCRFKSPQATRNTILCLLALNISLYFWI